VRIITQDGGSNVLRPRKSRRLESPPPEPKCKNDEQVDDFDVDKENTIFEMTSTLSSKQTSSTRLTRLVDRAQEEVDVVAVLTDSHSTDSQCKIDSAKSVPCKEVSKSLQTSYLKLIEDPERHDIDNTCQKSPGNTLNGPIPAIVQDHINNSSQMPSSLLDVSHNCAEHPGDLTATSTQPSTTGKEEPVFTSKTLSSLMGKIRQKSNTLSSTKETLLSFDDDLDLDSDLDI